jgi:hypothetical protein
VTSTRGFVASLCRIILYLHATPPQLTLFAAYPKTCCITKLKKLDRSPFILELFFTKLIIISIKSKTHRDLRNEAQHGVVGATLFLNGGAKVWLERTDTVCV